MAAEIESTIGVTPELIPSSGGCFEVVANGQLIFSKNQLQRFPQHEEILTGINNLTADH